MSQHREPFVRCPADGWLSDENVEHTRARIDGRAWNETRKKQEKSSAINYVFLARSLIIICVHLVLVFFNCIDFLVHGGGPYCRRQHAVHVHALATKYNEGHLYRQRFLTIWEFATHLLMKILILTTRAWSITIALPSKLYSLYIGSSRLSLVYIVNNPCSTEFLKALNSHWTYYLIEHSCLRLFEYKL